MSLKVGELYAVLALKDDGFYDELINAEKAYLATSENLEAIAKLHLAIGENLAKSLTIPIGAEAAAGMGAGAAEYDFSEDAAAMYANFLAAISAARGGGESAGSALASGAGAAAGDGGGTFAAMGAEAAADIGQGMASFSFAADAGKTLGNALGALTAAKAGVDAELTKLGNDMALGVGVGVADADFTAYAVAMVEKVKGAIAKAAGAHSPATEFMPGGGDMGAGVGVGFQRHDFGHDAEKGVSALRDAVNASAKRVEIDFGSMLKTSPASGREISRLFDASISVPREWRAGGSGGRFGRGDTSSHATTNNNQRSVAFSQTVNMGSSGTPAEIARQTENAVRMAAMEI